MSTFKVCEKTEEISVLPEGSMLVDNVTTQMRIVTSAGESMAPRSRAIVPSDDFQVKNLVRIGILRVVVAGTVKDLNQVILLNESGEQIGTTSIAPVLQETSEQVKKTRKKKTETQPEVESEVTENQEEEVLQEQNSSDVEISDIDTSTDNENPSV
jgi:hypothetical protein